MPKSDVYKKSRKLTYQALHKIFSETRGNAIDKENKPINPPQIGAKRQAIEAYKKCGRYAAHSIIREKFKRSDEKPAFSIEQIDNWIDEYEDSQKKVRDDDDAR